VVDDKLGREESDFDRKDMSNSANARHVRWEQLMGEYKGKIDIEAAKRFMGDHFDSFAKKEDAGERTLCGHVDLSPRGVPPWQPPYGAAGAVQNKAMDSRLAGEMAMVAAAGHACGIGFQAAPHLEKHPNLQWQKEFLRDMPSFPGRSFA